MLLTPPGLRSPLIVPGGKVQSAQRQLAPVTLRYPGCILNKLPSKSAQMPSLSSLPRKRVRMWLSGPLIFCNEYNSYLFIISLIIYLFCPSIDEWIKKMWQYKHNGILLSNKKERNSALCDNFDGPGEYMLSEIGPRQIPDDFTYM